MSEMSTFSHQLKLLSATNWCRIANTLKPLILQKSSFSTITNFSSISHLGCLSSPHSTLPKRVAMSIVTTENVGGVSLVPGGQKAERDSCHLS
jgi:hypothetical protein